MNKKLEICCYSAESAIIAAKAGAHRIELCDNFTEGGTTPSYATIKYVVDSLNIPVNVILRPRGGDFLYSDLEFEIMKKDALFLKSLGVNGVVFGILKENGELDIERIKLLKELTYPLEVTFHRAFDMCENLFKALEQLKNIGIQRILTSGGENTADRGLHVLSQLVEATDNEITIMPGSGINEKTIGIVMNETKAMEFHSSAKSFVKSRMNYFNPLINMGKTPNTDEYKKVSVDAEKIKDMLNIINAI